MGLETGSKNKLQRISVNNFAAEFFSKNYASKLFAILNERWMDSGAMKAGPIGGGALLTPLGHEFLQDNNISLIEKEDFEPADTQEELYTERDEDENILKGYNARFIVPPHKLESIYKEFGDPAKGYYENSPRRELKEELTYPPRGKYWPAVMTTTEFDNGYIGDQHVDTLQHTDLSGRRPGAVSHYNWHLYKVEVKDAFFRKLRQAATSSYFFEVDQETLRQVNSGYYIRPVTPALQSLKMILDSNQSREAKNGHQRKRIV